MNDYKETVLYIRLKHVYLMTVCICIICQLTIFLYNDILVKPNKGVRQLRCINGRALFILLKIIIGNF